MRALLQSTFIVLLLSEFNAWGFVPICGRSADAQKYILEFVNESYNSPPDVALNSDLCSTVGEIGNPKKFSTCADVKQKDLEIAAKCAPWYLATEYSDIGTVHVSSSFTYKRGDFANIPIFAVEASTKKGGNFNFDSSVISDADTSKLRKFSAVNTSLSSARLSPSFVKAFFPSVELPSLEEIDIQGKFEVGELAKQRAKNLHTVHIGKGFCDWANITPLLASAEFRQDRSVPQFNFDFGGQSVNLKSFENLAEFAGFLTFENGIWDQPCKDCPAFGLVQIKNGVLHGASFQNLNAQLFGLNNMDAAQPLPFHFWRNLFQGAKIGSFTISDLSGQATLEENSFFDFETEIFSTAVSGNITRGAIRNVTVKNPASSRLQVIGHFLPTGTGAYFSKLAVSDLNISSNDALIPGPLFDRVTALTVDLSLPNLMVSGPIGATIDELRHLKITGKPSMVEQVIRENQGIKSLVLQGESAAVSGTALRLLKQLEKLTYRTDSPYKVPVSDLTDLVSSAGLKTVILGTECGKQTIPASNQTEICQSPIKTIFTKLSSQTADCEDVQERPYCL